MNERLLFEASQNYFRTLATRPIDTRKQKLKSLKKSIKKHEKDLYAALEKDLGKNM